MSVLHYNWLSYLSFGCIRYFVPRTPRCSLGTIGEVGGRTLIKGWTYSYLEYRFRMLHYPYYIIAKLALSMP